MRDSDRAHLSDHVCADLSAQVALLRGPLSKKKYFLHSTAEFETYACIPVLPPPLLPTSVEGLKPLFSNARAVLR